jgi:hypothetical protein
VKISSSIVRPVVVLSKASFPFPPGKAAGAGAAHTSMAAQATINAVPSLLGILV